MSACGFLLLGICRRLRAVWIGRAIRRFLEFGDDFLALVEVGFHCPALFIRK
jgi:hypothetical protein